MYALPWTWKDRYSKRIPLHLIDPGTAEGSAEATCLRCGRRISLHGAQEEGPLPPYSYATDQADWEMFGSLSAFRCCTEAH